MPNTLPCPLPLGIPGPLHACATYRTWVHNSYPLEYLLLTRTYSTTRCALPYSFVVRSKTRTQAIGRAQALAHTRGTPQRSSGATQPQSLNTNPMPPSNTQGSLGGRALKPPRNQSSHRKEPGQCDGNVPPHHNPVLPIDSEMKPLPRSLPRYTIHMYQVKYCATCTRVLR